MKEKHGADNQQILTGIFHMLIQERRQKASQKKVSRLVNRTRGEGETDSDGSFTQTRLKSSAVRHLEVTVTLSPSSWKAVPCGYLEILFREKQKNQDRHKMTSDLFPPITVFKALNQEECFAFWWRAAVAKAGSRTDVSRCSSCRTWVWTTVGAGMCKQRVRSLDLNTLMMLQLSHSHHSLLRRVSHSSLMHLSAFTLPCSLTLHLRFFFEKPHRFLLFPWPTCSRPFTVTTFHLRASCPPCGRLHSHTLC